MAQDKTAASSEAMMQDTVIDARHEPEQTSPAAVSPFNRFSQIALTNSLIGYWLKGIAASIVMLCALMAIILILALHQNRPLPNWPFAITLNSLISIMVVIMKSCMLAIVAAGLFQTKWLWFERPHPLSHYVGYDKGSEGLADAVHLLWLLRGKQIIASLGLIIIITAVAIDPFTQQVIQYYQSTAASDVGGNATIPRAATYDSTGARLGAGTYAPGNSMIGAVMAGFWTPGSDSYVVSASNCLTGNCSFAQPYESLGICTSCNDISLQVSGSCQLGGYNSCNYTVPTGIALATSSTTGQFMVADDVANLTVTPPASWLTTRRFLWADGYPFPKGGNQSTTSETDVTCQGTGCPTAAAECYLYMCIQTYTAEVTNGILKEKIVSSAPVPTNSSSQCYGGFRRDCLESTDWAVLAGLGITPTTDSEADYISYCFDGNYDIGINPSCIYDSSFISVSSLQYLFTDFTFDGGPLLSGNLTGEQSYTALGPPELNYLYNGGALNYSTVAATFGSMAQTMTALVRNTPDLGMPAQGAVFYTQTLIRVQWAWLSLPLCLVAMTLLFMVVVMMLVTRKGRRPRRDLFSLNLLFKGVAEDTAHGHQVSGDEPKKVREGTNGKESRGEQEITESNMKKVQVQLVKVDGGGWKLVRL